MAETHGAVMWVAAGWLPTAWVVLRRAVALKRGYANFRTPTETGINIENLDKLTTATMRHRKAAVAGGPNSAKIPVSPGARVNVLIELRHVTALAITSLGAPRDIRVVRG